MKRFFLVWLVMCMGVLLNGTVLAGPKDGRVAEASLQTVHLLRKPHALIAINGDREKYIVPKPPQTWPPRQGQGGPTAKLIRPK